MEKEHRDFLINLQNELNTQSNDHNASPVFWAIRDYKWEICNDEFEEVERILAWNAESVYGDEIETFMRDYLNECETLTDDEISEANTILEEGDWESMQVWLNANYHANLDFIPQAKRTTICEDTMFITKADAKRHLELNHHHYSDKAHTYAMTAWRSPAVEKLWEVLRTADFSKVDKETPMKPVKGTLCGKCNSFLVINGIRYRRCLRIDCEQRVDWSDEE